MKTFNNINRAVERAKIKLTEKAREGGIYENFGQKEVAKFKERYSYHSLIYGTHKERLAASIIDKFHSWCVNFDLSCI